MRGPTRKWAMKISRLIAVSTAAGLLSGGLFGYPQLLDAGWSPEAALWLSVLGFVGPALVVAGLAIARTRSVSCSASAVKTCPPCSTRRGGSRDQDDRPAPPSVNGDRCRPAPSPATRATLPPRSMPGPRIHVA